MNGDRGQWAHSDTRQQDHTSATGVASFWWRRGSPAERIVRARQPPRQPSRHDWRMYRYVYVVLGILQCSVRRRRPCGLITRSYIHKPSFSRGPRAVPRRRPYQFRLGEPALCGSQPAPVWGSTMTATNHDDKNITIGEICPTMSWIWRFLKSTPLVFHVFIDVTVMVWTLVSVVTPMFLIGVDLAAMGFVFTFSSLCLQYT